MPLRLEDGWNVITFNMADFVHHAYGTDYIECQRVQIHANCRVRRIFFSDKYYEEDQMPPEFRLFVHNDSYFKQQK